MELTGPADFGGPTSILRNVPRATRKDFCTASAAPVHPGNGEPGFARPRTNVDEEFLGASLDFIDRQHKAGKPFFCWFNSTRMHIYTHLKPASKGKTGLGTVADGMTEFDGMVGQLLKKLDDLGIADNTIVVWTTDNGAEVFSWPDGGTTPFKGEKNTNWEGGYRVPCVVRWPG